MSIESGSSSRKIFFVTILVDDPLGLFGAHINQVLIERHAYARDEAHAIELALKEYGLFGDKVRAKTATLCASQSIADYHGPESILRDEPIAETWQGSVEVAPGGREIVLASGAQILREAGGHLEVAANEAVAVQLNNMPLPVVAWLKPCLPANAA